VQRLCARGDQVVGLGRSPAHAARAGAAGARIVPCDVGDPNTLAEAAEGVEVLFHCAGLRSHRTDPELVSWVHVAGTENLLAAARSAGVRRIVYLSCADVTLVNRDRHNWKESQGLGTGPIDACSRAKLLGEELARNATGRGLEVVALRPALCWGPGDTGRLPELCAEALTGGMRTHGDGHNLLATVYIDNLIDALLLAAEQPDLGGEAFHIADDEPVTCGEFLGQLSQALGVGPPRRSLYALDYAGALLRERLGQPGPCRADIALRGRGSLLDLQGAVNKLGHRPRVTMAEGMQALATWVQETGGVAAVAALPKRRDDGAELRAMQALANHQA
jgi:nucleoside-diphosphate-sugar epimerase